MKRGKLFSNADQEATGRPAVKVNNRSAFFADFRAAGILGVEMILADFTRRDFAVFAYFQALGV